MTFPMVFYSSAVQLMYLFPAHCLFLEFKEPLAKVQAGNRLLPQEEAIQVFSR